ncbi:hypothetical protein [Streptomyces sp. NPDC014734]|uniref:hypothetical protein n=1 Tax=Streptomyces sp. NPDC014734 TaxID=3364886 RepID=UPI0036FAE726
MRIYLTPVRRWWVALAALALLCVVCLKAGGAEVPLPTILSGVGGVPVRYFAPLLLVIAVMYCSERRLTAVERTAVTPIMLWDRLVLTTLVIALHLLSPLIGLEVARNTMLLLAVALVVQALSNEAAAGAVCLMLLLGVANTGRGYDPNGLVSARWWALPLQPSESVMAWSVALVLYAASLSLTAMVRR